MLPGVGLYLDGGFGVGKTHLLASAYYQLPGTGPDAPTCPKAFATFGELTQLAGVRLRRLYRSVGQLHRFMYRRVRAGRSGQHHADLPAAFGSGRAGVSVAATSNTLPEQLGEGRFAAQDFLREINTLASIFTTVRIEGPDYRHRDLPPAPAPLSDEEVAARATRVEGRPLTTSTRCARTWPPCIRRDI